MQSNVSARTLAASLKARLEMEQDLGVCHVPTAGLELLAGLAKVAVPAKPPRRPPIARDTVPAAPVLDEAREARAALPRPASDSAVRRLQRPTPGFFSIVPEPEVAPSPAKEAELAELRRQAMTCRNCQLAERRTRVVWGEGSLDAELMFIGEAPGRDEDEQGRPFVGKAGLLLTDMIEKGLKMPRGTVYIANMVKCRPPMNRDPKPEEVDACAPYLAAQLATIKPKILVAVGRIAGAAFSGQQPRMGSLRGIWHQYQGIPLRVIYHPAFLLRQRGDSGAKTKADRETWDDLKAIMAKLAELKS